MSYYDDERPRRHRSTRERRTRDDYDADPYYKSGGGARDTSLIRRPRNDSFSSVEEVRRDFPPAGGYQRKSTAREGRRARSDGGRDKYGDPYDDRSFHHDDYASSKRGSKGHDDKRRPRRRDSYSDSSTSRSPPRRRKSMGEQALAALGLGGVAAAATGKARDHSRSRRHRDRSSSSSSRSRSKRSGGMPRNKEEIAQALKAAVTAGAAEAFRSRKQPGGWGGDKGKRVLTAAISAGGVDKLIDRDPNKHGTRNVLGSALAGLATNRLVNGSRSRSRSRGRAHRGRARSESRGGLKDLASAGLVTAAGKSIYDRFRSKSRGRRSSSSSYDSYDSRSPPRRRDKKKRSSSISAYASKGLAALGLGEAADRLNGRDKHRSSTFNDDDYYHRASRNGAPEPYGGGGGYSDPREVGQPRSGENHSHNNGAMVHQTPGGVDLGPHRLGDPETDTDSDLGHSSEDERARRKARASQLITAGLASVATIHAAHNVYSSMEKRDERHEALAKGDISPEQARREKNKTRLQDAVSISIAALGVKGAVSEWKEMKEKREKALELKQKQERHHQKREARRMKMQSMGMQDRYTGSVPTLPSSHANANDTGYGSGAGWPTYLDDNPYSAGPLPPQAPYPPTHAASPALYPPYVSSPIPPPPGPPPARY
ncbi:hypothetical protein GJ744_008988 [Endocarpon pusillum]|uniref:DUF3824 domain-containing protein n=1 Tax=Endocarpon pusillum TaxID=364733 RepID=A0A8H7AKF6_9EURO|nr:hypothetical protein GJ744_008988 [Endocarpon pusillum]